MALQWKTRAAVVGLGVVACAAVGSLYFVMKGCKTILTLPNSMFAEIICPETIHRCSQVPDDQEVRVLRTATPPRMQRTFDTCRAIA